LNENRRPHQAHPNHFHEEKSEIAYALRLLAYEVANG
jgi:hypothetical protein